MKVGWGFITNPNSLWVKVLRSKYGCGSDLLPEVRRGRCESKVWKGVRRTWSSLMEGLVWKV